MSGHIQTGPVETKSAQTKTIKVPDQNHPIVIEPNEKRVVVSFAGHVIAETRDALTLREANYPAVLYIPRRDVNMTFFDKADQSTYCPYKGDCSYFSVSVDGKRSKSVAWTYEAPYPSVIEIRDHLAFYPDRVESIEEIAAS